MATQTGAERITAERRRQVEAEGWTAEHDEMHSDGELAIAAMAYARMAQQTVFMERRYGAVKASEMLAARMPWVWQWPWSKSLWKPSDDPVRNLEKAGALIAAEIDRLLREREKPQ